VYVRHAGLLARAGTLDALALAELIQSADGLRQEARFLSLIAVAQLYSEEPGLRAKAAAKRLLVALHAARGVDAGAVARLHAEPLAIAAAVKAARVAAVAAAIAD
jgi:tRNA nucleotidyltransferase (CCA-adding enzyme)